MRLFCRQRKKNSEREDVSESLTGQSTKLGCKAGSSLAQSLGTNDRETLARGGGHPFTHKVPKDFPALASSTSVHWKPGFTVSQRCPWAKRLTPLSLSFTRVNRAIIPGKSS